MAKRVVIVHGWRGRPDKGWLAWLAEELKARGIEILAPSFDSTGEHPKPKDWVDQLKPQIGRLDPNTVLVGHSMGVYVIINLLAHTRTRKPLAGVVLVAGGAWGELDWSKIKRLARRRVVIHSDNDPLVEPERSAKLARLIDAEAIVIPGRKHFGNFEDRPLEEALAAVLRQLA